MRVEMSEVGSLKHRIVWHTYVNFALKNKFTIFWLKIAKNLAKIHHSNDEATTKMGLDGNKQHGILALIAFSRKTNFRTKSVFFGSEGGIRNVI